VRLGDGYPATISPDGKWVAAFDDATPPKLMLLPTGAGDSRVPRLPPEFEPQDVSFAPDSQGIAVYGKSAALGRRVLLMDFDGGNARPLGPEEAGGIALFSPDGKRAVIRGAKGDYKIWPVTGGAPADLALQPNDRVLQWSADGLSLYLRIFRSTPPRIDRYELAKGSRHLWREIVPTDAAGVTQVMQISISRDGRFYAYSYIGTVKSDLYVLDGLQKKLW
jgi:Tol biopolymer transport system component